MVELTPDHIQNDTPSEPPHLIVVGPLSIDLQACVAKLHEQQIQLAKLEFSVLVYLANNAGHVVSAVELLREVWGCPEGGTPAQVKNCIKRLRQKIEPDPKRPCYLVTVYGHGYLMPNHIEAEPADSANVSTPTEN